MNSGTATIRCVNKKCKTINEIQNTFCHRCNTPILRNYLWIKGEFSQNYKVGDLIDDRFRLCYSKVVIDTKPDITIRTPEVIPEEIKPYLRLFSHRLHLPQIYGYLSFPEQAWLLEYESVPINNQGDLIYPRFFPGIESCLKKVSPLRQMNWLWQIVQLWQPLSQQKSLSSLFSFENIRVNGSIVKLIELELDQQTTPTLADLGDLFYSWLPLFDPLIENIIENITLSLQQNLFSNIDQVLNILDQSIYILGNNYYDRKFELITATDTGKKRKNNEDACYPEPNQLKKTTKELDTLAVICDGLGGQDGGEVASNLAIEIIHKSLQNSYKETLKKTLYSKNWTPLIDAEKIYHAISEANNKITHLNNNQKRRKLQRMGTTATISMAVAHEIYLANVGDSRIYWITPYSCHQVSIDDNIATKKVKKGDDLYRSISANRKSGTLLQALGMNFSSHLKIHIKRLILDEDSVFLLCSDGLSDYNRVEQYWRSEILPIIKQNKDLEQVMQSLMQIGLKKNGHDNITIALFSCQVEMLSQPRKEQELSWQYLNEIITDLPKPQFKNDNWFNSLWNTSFVHKTDNNKIRNIILILLTSSLLVSAVLFWHHKKSSPQQSHRQNLAKIQNLNN